MLLGDRMEADAKRTAANAGIGQALRRVLDEGIGVDAAAKLVDLEAAEVRRLTRPAGGEAPTDAEVVSPPRAANDGGSGLRRAELSRFRSRVESQAEKLRRAMLRGPARAGATGWTCAARSPRRGPFGTRYGRARPRVLRARPVAARGADCGSATRQPASGRAARRCTARARDQDRGRDVSDHLAARSNDMRLVLVDLPAQNRSSGTARRAQSRRSCCGSEAWVSFVWSRRTQ